jgi:putative flippase GtrA
VLPRWGTGATKAPPRLTPYAVDMLRTPVSRIPGTVVRFGLVGLVNTALDLALFWVLVPSLGVLTANFLSTSAGMAFSFFANGRHTFRSTAVTASQALSFLATNAFTMWLLQPAVISLAQHAADLPLPMAKLAGLAGSVVGNFLLYRHVVWRHRGLETVAQVGGRGAPAGARGTRA